MYRPYVLQLNVPGFLEETVAGIVAFLPRRLGALVVLLIGWVLGIAAAKVVRPVAGRVEIDRMVLETPIGRILGAPRLLSRTRSERSRSGSSMYWRSSQPQTCSRPHCSHSGFRRRFPIFRRSSPDCWWSSSGSWLRTSSVTPSCGPGHHPDGVHLLVRRWDTDVPLIHSGRHRPGQDGC